MGATLAERQKAMRQALLDVGVQTGWQKAMDYMCCALHDPDVMGRDAWGKDRILRLVTACLERDKAYHDAFENNKESDVARDHLDRELRDIFGDGMDDFSVRYEFIKSQRYNKSKKGWV